MVADDDTMARLIKIQTDLKDSRLITRIGLVVIVIINIVNGQLI